MTNNDWVQRQLKKNSLCHQWRNSSLRKWLIHGMASQWNSYCCERGGLILKMSHSGEIPLLIK